MNTTTGKFSGLNTFDKVKFEELESTLKTDPSTDFIDTYEDGTEILEELK